MRSWMRSTSTSTRSKSGPGRSEGGTPRAEAAGTDRPASGRPSRWRRRQPRRASVRPGPSTLEAVREVLVRWSSGRNRLARAPGGHQAQPNCHRHGRMIIINNVIIMMTIVTHIHHGDHEHGRHHHRHHHRHRYHTGVMFPSDQ